MYNARIRYLLMAFAIVAVIIFAYKNEIELAAASGFLFFFVVWSHFRTSSILLASKHFKNGDHERALSLLAEVPNPDRLAKNRRGYYEFMLANIALKKEDYEAAEFHFQIASRFPLGGKNEKSYVLIHLANIALRNKDTKRALVYTDRAKELALSERAISLIDRIEKEVNKLNKENNLEPIQ